MCRVRRFRMSSICRLQSEGGEGAAELSSAAAAQPRSGRRLQRKGAPYVQPEPQHITSEAASARDRSPGSDSAQLTQAAATHQRATAAVAPITRRSRWQRIAHGQRGVTDIARSKERVAAGQGVAEAAAALAIVDAAAAARPPPPHTPPHQLHPQRLLPHHRRTLPQLILPALPPHHPTPPLRPPLLTPLPPPPLCSHSFSFPSTLPVPHVLPRLFLAVPVPALPSPALSLPPPPPPPRPLAPPHPRAVRPWPYASRAVVLLPQPALDGRRAP